MRKLCPLLREACKEDACMFWKGEKLDETDCYRFKEDGFCFIVHYLENKVREMSIIDFPRNECSKAFCPRRDG